MAGGVRTTALSRQSTTTLAADPVLQGSVAASTTLLLRVGLRVSAASGNGGFRFNLRLPSGATAFMFEPWKVVYTDRLAAVLGLPEAGIGINVGASMQDYFTWDLRGDAFSVVIHGAIAFQTGTAGTAAIEWCQNRSVAIPTTLGVASAFSAGAP